MSRVLIILREAFTDLGGGCADHRIEIRVVVRFTRKYLDAQGALLELPRMAVQRAFDYIAQEVRVSLAVLEERVGEYPLQLGLDRSTFGFVFGNRSTRRNGLRDLNA